MTNICRVDFANNLIIMDRTFAKRCENTSSVEYAQLQRVRADYPTFTVQKKQIRKNADKETYKGLTYAYMEKYIALHDDETGTIRKAYDEKILISECHKIKYPVIKKWFLKQFPEVAEFGVDEESVQENEENANQNLAVVKSSAPASQENTVDVDKAS